MTHDTGSPKAVKKKIQKERLADKDRAAVVQALMGTRIGRRWIWELLESAHIFASSFRGDDARTNFAEGERNHGLQLLAQIMRHSPEGFIMAMKEDKEDDDRSNNDSTSDDGSGSDSGPGFARIGSDDDTFGTDSPANSADGTGEAS